MGGSLVGVLFHVVKNDDFHVVMQKSQSHFNSWNWGFPAEVNLWKSHPKMMEELFYIFL